MEETKKSHRNVNQTPMNPNCRLCHYAGYSNLCTFAHGGECPYMTLRNNLQQNS